MVLFTEIECVQKDGTLIVEIYGTIAPQSSDGQPTKARLRAIKEAKGPIEYIFPDGKKKFIQFFTTKGTKCFFLEGDTPEKNHLEQFPECES